MISSAPEIEELAKTVDDNGGAYFVPAFSGPVRAVLALRRARRARRASPATSTRATSPARCSRPRRSRPARSRRHERRLGRAADDAQGRRRHGRQRDAHAVPGRPPRRRRSSGPRSPRRRPWAPRTRPGSPSASGTPRTTSATTGPRTRSGPRRWTTDAARQDLRAVEEGRHQDLRLGVTGRSPERPVPAQRRRHGHAAPAPGSVPVRPPRPAHGGDGRDELSSTAARATPSTVVGHRGPRPRQNP